ncbi:MAG: hypothetical protein ACM3UX_00975 [Candidatus Woesearchaeota archaeon]
MTPRALLQRLIEHDDECLGRMLVPNAVIRGWDWPGDGEEGLDPRTIGLIRLAALFALDAPTASLRWGLDLASAAGVDDAQVVAALVSAASAECAARIASGGPDLAGCLGYLPGTEPVRRSGFDQPGLARPHDRL